MLVKSNPDEKKDLINAIDSIREKMIQTGMQEGLASVKTLTLSQTLDEYITKYQSIQLTK
ncbi:aspartyl-phosphate phosphatase Spo0E family protein [Niallia endozanthoxylica]|uniref:Aspartyl-phosphate phosphatase Spo0E family protein n=1 Tax=Niallia endozanthoxylica TaxID=2036016 RepID=A0A5J5I210_9BACI|nr:aspartyl-phosphate phosphatase Spo0E family protein [Niallia endozanthoxylica]KAA9029920.1 aspartyl-phosphate phosphatase Spo0E family protein [Niallia endozanthoxylica]